MMKKKLVELHSYVHKRGPGNPPEHIEVDVTYGALETAGLVLTGDQCGWTGLQELRNVSLRHAERIYSGQLVEDGQKRLCAQGCGGISVHDDPASDSHMCAILVTKFRFE
jgi:hypothetical protein